MSNIAYDSLQNLRKRMVMMKMTLSEPKSPSMELELEGGVEELRKDKQIYQKRALLLLRYVSTYWCSL